ncbi:hypothetical protein AGMMS50268_20490 [Spirochaetia bacterium]|nr:hypothetical protein AGMMS50268_20490 [Spirochaetia bacterium]
MAFKSLTDSYKLSNGVEIPCIGFGTWQVSDGAAAVSSVKAAIKAGKIRAIGVSNFHGRHDFELSAEDVRWGSVLPIIASLGR